MFFSKTTMAACGLATLANAHMLMNTPKPFNTPHLSNGPLDASGSDFPCKVQNGQKLVADGASNTFALGSSQPLRFTGQAVHGGGSCQISITYDQQPTKNSVWKVIHSIEGGCPAKGQTGNMGSDANALAPDTYNFTVPTDIPTGDVVLAWTWFNKIGNREMYMNCAPVTLTGNGGDKSGFEKLPDMFVANVGNGCSTPDSTDLLFPNPGEKVDRLNGATSAFAQPSGSCQAAKAPGGGSGSGSGSGSSATSTSAAAAQPTKTGVPGAVFKTVSPSDTSVAQAPATPTTTAAPKPSPATGNSGNSGNNGGNAGSGSSSGSVSSAAPKPAPVPGSSGNGNSSGVSGAKAAGSPCTPEGAWLCLSKAYQQCASGTWSTVMSLAAGTTCTQGQGGSINIAAASGKKKRVALRFRG